MKLLRASAKANANIAIVKYWGKRDKKLILPFNSSLSVTLDEKLSTVCTVAFSDQFQEDEVFVIFKNKVKKLKTKEELEKISKQLNFIREIAKTNLKAKIVSKTSIPPATGLASSSAGLCASALAAVSALNLKLAKEEIALVARIGSGSACRSLYGGFVIWERGKKKDGSDSLPYQLKDENFWKDFRIVIGIIEEKEKEIKSREGMERSVETSFLFKKRIEILPQIIEKAKKAILKKDYRTLFEIAMREANNLHAILLDTWPPIIYLNDLSKLVIKKILEFNKDSIKAGYTFDAGPNPIIFTLKRYVPKIKTILKECNIKKIIISKIGSGAQILKNYHLIDTKGNISF
jgi:diphosphomevalonate decarboxylase